MICVYLSAICISILIVNLPDKVFNSHMAIEHDSFLERVPVFCFILLVLLVAW